MTAAASSSVGEPTDSGASEAGRRSRLQRVGVVLSWALTVCVVIAAGLMLVPSLLGYHRYVITSGSMEPALPTGSVVYDKPRAVADLQLGEIITFVPPAEYGITIPVTHRIVAINEVPAGSQIAGAPAEPGTRSFNTRGDANASVDPWQMVPDDPEVDRVEHHLPYVGYAYMALNHRWVQLLLIGLPALAVALLIGVALWREAGDAVDRDHAVAVTASPERKG